MFRRSTKWIGVVLLALLFAGCGGSSKETDTSKGDGGGVAEVATYINLSPTDTQVLTTDQPTFKFERNINNTSSAVSCTGNSGALHDVQVKVIKIDTQTANAVVVVDEVVHVPNECQFEVQFPSLTLEENVGYAWRAGKPNEVENAQTAWNSFVYSTVSMGLEDSNPHACEKNMVQDWSFLEQKTAWRSTDTSNFSSNIPASVINQGHDDNGAATLATPNTIIYQVLSHPIIQGKYYQLKFSLKHEGKSDFQIKALAFNGMLDDLQPDANTSIIAVTGIMTHQGNWIKITLNPWKANSDFSSLAIALVNDQNQTVNALIDRVCLVEVNGGGCGEEVDVTINVPDGFDINDSDPVVTDFEYLLGTVADLYPTEDVSNSEWFLEGNSSTLECTTVGESTYTPEEEAEFEDAESNDSEISDLHDDLDQWIKDHNNTSAYDNNDTNLTTITPVNTEKCTERIVDYTKPFSGRDIVYVHGLQKDAIDDLKRLPWNKKHEGRWPINPNAFTSHGSYYSVARPYWEDHIVQTLGSMTSPSNSYMIATWSGLQRAKIGINAILHEIRDARSGNNDLVQLSDNAKNNRQCFGDNGIVFVTHSTGGTLISLMFGNMEIHKNDPGYVNYVDPGLRELFDAQVGFNAAYRGSAVATAGLMTTHSALYPTEAIKSVLVDLGVPLVSYINSTIMNRSQKPTLMLIGSEAGKHNGGTNTGGRIFLKGYNDTVLASWSQAAHRKIRPKYWIDRDKRRLLLDKGASVHKRVHMVRKGRFLSAHKRRYYVSAAFAPSGMLQDAIFAGYVHPRVYINNHFPIIQTTGDHFDNVNFVSNNGKNYYKPKNTNEFNNEETSVVMHPSLYANHYLSTEFQNLQQAWVKKKTWGFNFLKLSWVRQDIILFGHVVGWWHAPKITWHYYEYIKWKRTYHLLKDYKTKNGADYMYKYLLRP